MVGGSERVRGGEGDRQKKTAAEAHTHCVPYWSLSVMPSMRTRRPTSIARAAARLSRL